MRLYKILSNSFHMKLLLTFQILLHRAILLGSLVNYYRQIKAQLQRLKNADWEWRLLFKAQSVRFDFITNCSKSIYNTDITPSNYRNSN